MPFRDQSFLTTYRDRLKTDLLKANQTRERKKGNSSESIVKLKLDLPVLKKIFPLDKLIFIKW